MSESPWLDAAEVAQLTADAQGRPCKRRTTQCDRLAMMGIPFRPCYGGRPLVERAAVLKYRERTVKRAAEPDWSAVHGTKAA